MVITKYDKAIRAVIYAFYFSVFILSFLAPVLQEIKGYPAGENLYSLFSPICHQYPTRCFWVFERPWALCARCASGYLGFAVAALISRLQFPFWKRSLIGLLLIGLAAIDPLLQLFGFYESNNILRLITGLIGGYGTFLFVYPLPLKYKEQAL
ncbi:MAG: DUF2085 domain-containing protein, partial [Bacteroidota bacterium]